MSEILSENEKQVMTIWCRFGSDSYPIRKAGNYWFVDGQYNCGSCPSSFKTKKTATAQWEAYINSLIDRKAGRA